LVLDDYHVIEHQNDFIRQGRDLIEQGRQNRLGGRRLGGREHSQHPGAKIWGCGLQG